MNLVDLVALALATGGLIDCWLNGSIFAGKRDRLKDWPLFACDYCLNWQAPFWLLLLFYLPSLWLPSPWDVVLRLPIYWLAAAYMAWLVNEYRADRDLDYVRTARAAADMEQYGSGPATVMSAAGVGDDDTSAGTAAAAAPTPDKPAVPALRWHVGCVAYFCSPECREKFAKAKEADVTHFTRWASCDYDAEARCARCYAPLGRGTPSGPPALPTLAYPDGQVFHFCSVGCRNSYGEHAQADCREPAFSLDNADYGAEAHCAWCNKNLQRTLV